jgi:hypothetical protein
MDISAFISSVDDLKIKIPWAKGKDVWVAYRGADDGAVTDVFVHFHGFLYPNWWGKDPNFVLSNKAGGKVSGSGMQDPKTKGALPLPGKNVLMIVPCGKQVSKESEYVITSFDGLDVPGLVEACLLWRDALSEETFVRDFKLTCTGHSGGGNALHLVTQGKLGAPDPAAIHFYDATYTKDKDAKAKAIQAANEASLKSWAAGSGKQLCVAYRAGTDAYAKKIEGWKLPKFRIAKALCEHEEVPGLAFPYFLTGKTTGAKKMDPPTCSPL